MLSRFYVTFVFEKGPMLLDLSDDFELALGEYLKEMRGLSGVLLPNDLKTKRSMFIDQFQ